MKTLALLLPLIFATSAAHADPQLTSWLTANSGKYSRAYPTSADRTSGNALTAWTNHTTAPAYSDVYEVSYSTSWVYTKYTGLPSYVIGPWLNPQGATSNFYPVTQSVIRRFPRTPTVPATTAKSNVAAGTSGILVNGVAAFNSLDGKAWDGSAIQGGAQHFSATYYWHQVAPVAEAFNFDYSLGHQLPAGLYHNHQNPTALRYQLGDHVDYNSTTKNYSESAATVTAHSPLLGYAHDGYPIYGPYGYSTAMSSSSGLRRMVSGFAKRNGGTTGVDTVTSATTTLPTWYIRYRTNHSLATGTVPARSTDTTTYPIGQFAQDYSYLGDLIKTGSTYYAQGTDFDLDEYNGRTCVTPEYPSGTYAYFITIDSSGNSVFPYIFNFEHYGSATGGTVTSITESVTSQTLAGPATAITLNGTPSASGGNVTLTWNSVEGSAYTVENSTNQFSWTTRTTGLAATSNSTTTSNSIATIGSSGTEYGRVTRTALATYDVPTVASAVTTSQTGTGTYSAGANNAPTLTTISTLTGATNGSAYTIDYATLAAAANEADADGNAISFRVEVVSNGTLTKSGSAVTAGTTLLSTGESLVWTPSGTGTIQAFTVKAYDGAAASSTAVAVNVTVGAANNAPTLTTISTLTGGTEDTALSISYATLAAAADEADLDGNAISFRVEAVSSGTLTKSGSAVTAGSTLLSTGESLVWTPASNANGTLAAFTVKAYDGTAVSSTAVTVNVSVAAVNDGPTLTAITTLTGAALNTAFTISYTTLAAAADEADADGTTPSFRVEAVSAGTLTKGGTAVTAGTTTLASGESLVWTPATGFTGTTAAFTVKAHDGTLTSATAISVNVTVGASTADIRLTSWYTANSGKYARISETDAEAVAGTTKTTWTRTTGGFTLAQTTPTYAGPTQIDYSTSWVYVRTGSLATYNMGPWYNNAAKSQLFINVPKNQGFIIRIPRTTTIPTTKTQINGLNIGGVQQPAGGYYVDGVAIYDPTDGFSYSGGTETSPGTGQWHRDAYVNESITFDYSMAHQQNTGVYHNHANPIALRHQLGDAVSFNNTTKQYAETLSPTQHSPIIGWMIDGLPVYGPYGYSTATDANSGVRRMVGGFVKRDGTTTGVDNITTAGRTLPAWMLRNNNNTAATGPTVSTTYPLGRYIQDWAYLGDLVKAGGGNYTQGTDFDLNEYNVRYCVTPEFPSGTWAYFLNISSTGTPQFPYMCNRWFYGTPTGGKVNSVAETVTNHMLGGPNRPLSITNTSVSSPNVTLTWDAVEGGTYSVDASADNTNWTSKATGLPVSAANTKSNSHATLGSTGTEYARVNRTALATYDTTGVVTPTVAQTTSTSFALATLNVAPTLTTINPLANGTEDIAYNITYAAVAAAADEADSNGDAISFKVVEVFSGTLTKNGSAVIAGTWLSSGDTFVWTPPANANGLNYPMSVQAYDGSLASANAVGVPINLTPVNDAPTISSNSLGFAILNTQTFEFTYSNFVLHAPATDAEGDTISYRIESVPAGTLTKNGGAVIPGTTTVGTGETIIWTPPAGTTTGSFTAFTAKAWDGSLASTNTVTITVNVSPITATLSGWASTFALTAADADETADPDNDGRSNALEYTMGSDPTVSDVATRPITSSVSGGYFTMTFSRYDDSEQDMFLQAQYSTNLTTWTTISIGGASTTSGGVIITVTENGTGLDTISVQVPVGANTRMFSRINTGID
jgi:YHYH protein